MFCALLLSAKISLSVATSSGSFGQAKIGSSICDKSISKISAYLASLSALKRVGFSSHFCIFSFRLASVSRLSYPAFIIASISATFERTYSVTLASLKFTTQAAAERSAEASLSSNACSTFRLSSPSISKILPAKMFFLFFFSTLKSPFLIAK